MSGLIKYNTTYVCQPQGLINTGSICYLNSLLQALMGCSSFIEQIHKLSLNTICNPDPIAKLFVDICIYNKKNINLGANIYHILQSGIDGKLFEGQQCFHEGFDIMINKLSTELSQLFSHTYKTYSFCFECKQWSQHKKSIENVFLVNPEFKIDGQQLQIEKYILTPEMKIQNLNCGLCGNGKEKKIKYILSIIPEILIVIAQKYNISGKLNTNTPFPEFLNFNMCSNSNIKYIAVAQIEHIGGKDGGHYYSISRRNDKWYNFNDMNISYAEFKPTINTYAVFYHVI